MTAPFTAWNSHMETTHDVQVLHSMRLTGNILISFHSPRPSSLNHFNRSLQHKHIAALITVNVSISIYIMMIEKINKHYKHLHQSSTSRLSILAQYVVASKNGRKGLQDEFRRHMWDNCLNNVLYQIQWLFFFNWIKKQFSKHIIFRALLKNLSKTIFPIIIYTYNCLRDWRYIYNWVLLITVKIDSDILENFPSNIEIFPQFFFVSVCFSSGRRQQQHVCIIYGILFMGRARKRHHHGVHTMLYKSKRTCIIRTLMHWLRFEAKFYFLLHLSLSFTPRSFIK